MLLNCSLSFERISGWINSDVVVIKLYKTKIVLWVLHHQKTYEKQGTLPDSEFYLF